MYIYIYIHTYTNDKDIHTPSAYIWYIDIPMYGPKIPHPPAHMLVHWLTSAKLPILAVRAQILQTIIYLWLVQSIKIHLYMIMISKSMKIYIDIIHQNRSKFTIHQNLLSIKIYKLSFSTIDKWERITNLTSSDSCCNPKHHCDVATRGFNRIHSRFSYIVGYT